MTNACHHDMLSILAGCEAGLPVENAIGTGKKPHTAGPALERDDSAMEEAWVCSTPNLSCVSASSCMPTSGGSSMGLQVQNIRGAAILMQNDCPASMFASGR